RLSSKLSRPTVPGTSCPMAKPKSVVGKWGRESFSQWNHY
ncbi:uncharacterized protein METZ01_LOCUS384714, partial [marine metagenome]